MGIQPITHNSQVGLSKRVFASAANYKTFLLLQLFPKIGKLCKHIKKQQIDKQVVRILKILAQY